MSEMSGVVQASSTEKTAKHMFINLKSVHSGDGSTLHPRCPTRVQQIPLHHISLFIENLSYTEAKMLNLLPDDIQKYRLISNYVMSMFYFEQAAHK